MWRVAAFAATVVVALVGVTTSVRANDIEPVCVELQESMGRNWQDAGDRELRRWWEQAQRRSCPQIADDILSARGWGDPVAPPPPPPPPSVQPTVLPTPSDNDRGRNEASTSSGRQRARTPPQQPPPQPSCPETAIGWIDLSERQGLYFAPGFTDGTPMSGRPTKTQRLTLGPSGVPFYRSLHACEDPSGCHWNESSVFGDVVIVDLERFEVGMNGLRRWQLCVRQ